MHSMKSKIYVSVLMPERMCKDLLYASLQSYLQDCKGHLYALEQ